MPVLTIDCEGPITQNDNAFELCKAMIPGGGEFFATVSRYDDFLADIERREGYKAGDTLRLILPFLKAFGATYRGMEAFSERTLLLLPGARELLPVLDRLLPTFIISTSYRPYLDALCVLTGFPREQVFCTDLDLDAHILTEEEEKAIKGLAAEIASQPLLSWPDAASSREDLSVDDRRVVERLDRIFWEELPSMGIGRLLTEVDPVGGAGKAKAVSAALERTGQDASDCIYVGDSITDVDALSLVRAGGGAAVSFNGNSYALKAAGYACISPHTAIIGAIARLVVLRGTGALARLAGPTGEKVLKGEPLLAALSSLGVEDPYISPLRETTGPGFPAFFMLDGMDIRPVTEESEAMRRRVRGLAVGSLG